MKDIQKLPQAVREFITSDEDINVNSRIRDDFDLTTDQLKFLLDLIIRVISGEVATLNFPSHLAKMPDSDWIDLRKLGLRVAMEKFFPLREYISNVDVLINRLGGTVPRIEQDNASPSDDELSDWFEANAKDVLKERQLNELYLTQKPLKDDDDRLKSPTANNWLQDYLHTMGAESGGSLKRSQYMARSRNTAQLNDSERENLLNFLTSYDDDSSMYWHVEEEKYLVVEPELPETQKREMRQQKSQQTMQDLLEYYQSIVQNYDKQFTDSQQGLAVEINGVSTKLRDIIWESLGLGEADRCLAAIAFLIERHGFMEMMKSDQRFKGIIARSLDAHYGAEAKRFWDGDTTTPVMLAIFWKLILIEKLSLEEPRAAIIADYFSKKLGQKASPLFLDLVSGAFRFREIVYQDRALQFAA